MGLKILKFVLCQLALQRRIYPRLPFSLRFTICICKQTMGRCFFCPIVCLLRYLILLHLHSQDKASRRMLIAVFPKPYWHFVSHSVLICVDHWICQLCAIAIPGYLIRFIPGEPIISRRDKNAVFCIYFHNFCFYLFQGVCFPDQLNKATSSRPSCLS